MSEKKRTKLSIGTAIFFVIAVGILLAMLLPRSAQITKGMKESSISKNIEDIEESKSISGYQQKIITTAELKLEVKDFREAIRKVRKIAEDMQGFVSDSQEYITDGKHRGSIVLRIPQARFNEAITMIESVGKVEYSQIKGEDVTKEYIDLKARLTNQEAAKKRFLRILEEETKEFDDIIKVEQELKRIGEEIERLQGEIRYLEDQVGLSTIEVNMYEPTAIIPSGFNPKEIFRDAICKGIENCIRLTAQLILWIETLLPLIFLAILILTIRDYWRRRKEKFEKKKEVQDEKN